MPTYEYRCAAGHHFEEVQRITEPPLGTCRKCDARAHRLISQGNFILKGGGWYSDGYGTASKSTGKTGKKTTGAADST